MPEYRRRNALAADLPVPAFFWNGETGMRCVSHALTRVRETGWTHHIERLMILGNFGLIAGFDPQAFTDWFWEMFVDGYDWVMVPSVIGMTLFADGGLLATKPYAASANYIDRMSDYCTPCRYRRKGLLEDDACPFNALYWSFLLRNERAFSGNRRMTLVIKQLQGRDAAWRVAVTNKADAIRARLRSGDPI